MGGSITISVLHRKSLKFSQVTGLPGSPQTWVCWLVPPFLHTSRHQKIQIPLRVIGYVPFCLRGALKYTWRPKGTRVQKGGILDEPGHDSR